MSTQNLEIPGAAQLVTDTNSQTDPEDAQISQHAIASASSGRTREFYSSLREIQAELEDLHSILASIRSGKSIIPTYADYIETTKTNLKDLIAFINSNEVPAEVEKNLHTFRHLNNAWEQMRVSPLIENPNARLEIQQQLHFLDLLDSQIHGFHYQISLLTVPYQINEWLRITGPGYYIPFHEVFADEVPNSEDRDSLLKYIALTPHLTPGGFVDIESGRIYRYSTQRFRRLLSLGMLLAGLGVATGIVAAACFLPAPDWPLRPDDLPKMLVAWVAVLIGMGVHILVGSAKRSKTQSSATSALMNLFLIIDARFGEIGMKLLLGLVGLFGLVMISAPGAPQLGALNPFPTLTQVNPLNAFLVGYSLDSILELFGTNLEGASQVKTLIKK